MSALIEKSHEFQAEVQVIGIKQKRLQDPTDNPVSISLFSVLHPIYTRTSLNHRRGKGGGGEEGVGVGRRILRTTILRTYQLLIVFAFPYNLSFFPSLNRRLSKLRQL